MRDNLARSSLSKRHLTNLWKGKLFLISSGKQLWYLFIGVPLWKKSSDRIMKTSLMITLLIGLVIIGCATRQIHSVTIFSIQGRVLDRESNFPLEKVDVFFVDTGYDYALSKQRTPIKVAETNSRGKIEARLNYLWKRREAAFSHPPEATLDIVLSKGPYKTEIFHFKESELKTDGVAFLINLDDVYMIRESE